MPEITLNLSEKLMERLNAEADRLRQTPQTRALRILEDSVAPAANLRPGAIGKSVAKLRGVLASIPAVTVLSVSEPEEPYWWVKVEIDISSRIAWHVVQELGFVLNEVSLTERFPTLFKPVSPPPYLNGGPEEYLSWVVEATLPFVDAGQLAEALRESLPKPIDDEEAWLETSDEEEDEG